MQAAGQEVGMGRRGRRTRLWRGSPRPHDGPPLYSVISGEAKGRLKRSNVSL